MEENKKKELIIPLKAVFFDFDGVILDSVNVKTEAFAKMFRSYGSEVEQKVVDYHLAHCGISRFNKFRYYYEKLLNKSINEEEIANLGDKFSQLVLQGVLEAPFIEGALESLQLLHKQNIPAFVVSGTPEEELKFIIKRRNIEVWFKEVHGSPRLKHEIIQDIQKRYNIESSKSLFVGDAMTDYNAAKATGTRFFGIVSKNTSSPFPQDTQISSTVCFLSE
ncbi:MAG: HAD family hydrolase [Desulfamplus sp.]|nr:HAD family hydrolase [Desulfamplus sp.]